MLLGQVACVAPTWLHWVEGPTNVDGTTELLLLWSELALKHLDSASLVGPKV